MSEQRDEGIALLSKAKDEEAQGNYQESIDSMKRACELLISAGLWGDEEQQTIDEEITRLSSLIITPIDSPTLTESSSDAQNAQDQGISLLETAREQEANGQLQESIQSLQKAVELLTSCGIWGNDEKTAIDEEIKRINGQIKQASIPAATAEITQDLEPAPATTLAPVPEPVPAHDGAQERGIKLIQKAKDDETSGKYQDAIDSMKEACELLIQAGLWGNDEKTAIDEEIERVTALIIGKNAEEVQAEGISHLEKAKELEQYQQYEEVIEEMEKARDILVGAGIWGETEQSIIESEINRINTLMNTVNIEELQAEGILHLEHAKELEEEKEYEEAIKEMEEAKNILVDSKIWGADEEKILLEEIERIKQLMVPKAPVVPEPMPTLAPVPTPPPTPLPLSEPKAPMVPEPILTLTPVPTPAPMPAPVPEPKAPVVPEPMPTPAPIPTPPPTPAPIPAPVPEPKAPVVPEPMPTPAPIPTPPSTPAPVPEPKSPAVPDPMPTLAPVPTPIAAILPRDDELDIPELNVEEEDPLAKATILIQAGQKYENEEFEYHKAAVCMEKATDLMVDAGLWGIDQLDMAREQIALLREDAKLQLESLSEMGDFDEEGFDEDLSPNEDMEIDTSKFEEMMADESHFDSFDKIVEDEQQYDTRGVDINQNFDDDLGSDPLAMLKHTIQETQKAGFKAKSTLSLSVLTASTEHKLDQAIEKADEIKQEEKKTGGSDLFKFAAFEENIPKEDNSNQNLKSKSKKSRAKPKIRLTPIPKKKPAIKPTETQSDLLTSLRNRKRKGRGDQVKFCPLCAKRFKGRKCDNCGYEE